MVRVTKLMPKLFPYLTGCSLSSSLGAASPSPASGPVQSFAVLVTLNCLLPPGRFLALGCSWMAYIGWEVCFIQCATILRQVCFDGSPTWLYPCRPFWQDKRASALVVEVVHNLLERTKAVCHPFVGLASSSCTACKRRHDAARSAWAMLPSPYGLSAIFQ